VLLPRQQAKLARGAKDKEHVMSQTPNTAIAVIGIDIGKNRVIALPPHAPDHRYIDVIVSNLVHSIQKRMTILLLACAASI
jgi:hypothetical protein